MEKLVNTFNTGLLISNNTAAFESNEDIHQEERINTQTATSVTEAQALSDPLRDDRSLCFFGISEIIPCL